MAYIIQKHDWIQPSAYNDTFFSCPKAVTETQDICTVNCKEGFHKMFTKAVISYLFTIFREISMFCKHEFVLNTPL